MKGGGGEAPLICAAVDEELAAFRAIEFSTRLRAEAIGVGPVDAALGAAAALHPDTPWAIFIGSCGAFPGSGLRIGEAVLVADSLLGSSDAATGRSYIPAAALRPSSSDPALVHDIATATGLRPLRVVTTVAITSDEESARRLALRSEAQAEHLEAHAFLRAAERAGVPAACILGVSNEVGPQAHEQWKAHADEAAAAATAALLRYLRS